MGGNRKHGRHLDRDAGPQPAVPTRSDDELASRWVTAMAGKRAGHGMDDESFLQPTRPMSAIGG